eukprot:1693206-Rhodomonas_salina.1
MTRPTASCSPFSVFAPNSCFRALDFAQGSETPEVLKLCVPRRRQHALDFAPSNTLPPPCSRTHSKLKYKHPHASYNVSWKCGLL